MTSAGTVARLDTGRFRVTYSRAQAGRLVPYFATFAGGVTNVSVRSARFTVSLLPMPSHSAVDIDGTLGAVIRYRTGAAGVSLAVHYLLVPSPRARVPAPRTDGVVEDPQQLFR